MEKYDIQFAIKAKEDLRDMIAYIKNELLEPTIALKYAQTIKNEIKKLEQLPERFAVIDIDSKECENIRKLVVKNYVIFYRISEVEKTVQILRILYGGSDWKNIL